MSAELLTNGDGGLCPAIAQVAVEVSLPHLDRFFDYAIPPKMAAEAVIGARVRVRFAGRTVSGFIVGLPSATDSGRKLTPLSKIISTESVLSLEQIALIRQVADHYAGVFSDVARLAVPPRHAATELAEPRPWPEPAICESPAGGLLDYEAGESFLNRILAGESLRAHWLVSPRCYIDQKYSSVETPDDWTRGIVQACVATLKSGRGVCVVVPDRKDLTQLGSALAATVGRGAIAELHADLGPSARYRNYLAVRRGQAKIVIGTRAAVFAPVRNLGLIIVFDDGDDLLAEPRAPYPHARDVAALRVGVEGCGLLFVSYNRSCEVARWVKRGWLNPIEVSGAEQRRRAPAVKVSADSDYALARDPLSAQIRLPHLVFETIKMGLLTGPVLVQVPRGGYFGALTCQRCRTALRCSSCQGPVEGRRIGGQRVLTCRWCGSGQAEWSCAVCGGTQVRAPVVGSVRTAEELGLAFPSFRLVDSSGEQVKETVDAQPAIVVATPGAEPLAELGYAAAVLLDAQLALTRADLRAGEEALRRWLNAMALVRPGADGGTVCIVGPSEDRVIQALVRVDPAGFSYRELSDRELAGFPPSKRFIELTGDPKAVQELIDGAQLSELSDEIQLLGPTEQVRSGEVMRQVLFRSPSSVVTDVTRALKASAALRSATKSAGQVRIRVDPVVLA